MMMMVVSPSGLIFVCVTAAAGAVRAGEAAATPARAREEAIAKKRMVERAVRVMGVGVGEMVSVKELESQPGDG
jgi:membrane protein required for beta-lactamase induction